MPHVKHFFSAVLVATALTTTSALAAGSGGSDYSSASSSSYEIKKANKAISAEDFPKAYSILTKAVKTSPKDADIHNLLGYSARKMGQYDASEGHYTRALELDPKHKGALEYMGELYLTLNQLDKAEALRDRLDKVCWLGCDELDELNEAIADWKSNNS